MAWITFNLLVEKEVKLARVKSLFRSSCPGMHFRVYPWIMCLTSSENVYTTIGRRRLIFSDCCRLAPDKSLHYVLATELEAVLVVENPVQKWCTAKASLGPRSTAETAAHSASPTVGGECSQVKSRGACRTLVHPTIRGGTWSHHTRDERPS